jgi:hypothetical protein
VVCGERCGCTLRLNLCDMHDLSPPNPTFTHLHMPWTRRRHPRLPNPLITPQHKQNLTPLHHNIPMLKPIPLPLHPVNPHPLHIIPSPRPAIIQSLRADPQRAVVIDGDVDIVEPRALEEVHGCRDNRVEAEHLPDKPAVERTGVRVARDAGAAV